MPDVVIEGSLTPAVGVLERGERRTVALTPHVQDLIDRGYIVVVETIETPEPTVVEAPVEEVEPPPVVKTPRTRKATDG